MKKRGATLGDKIYPEIQEDDDSDDEISKALGEKNVVKRKNKKSGK